MTPDGPGCNIQIVNATGESIVIGTPPAGQQPFHSYQMQAWFPNLGVGSVLAPAGGTGSSFAQALRGGGDQDDSANLPVNMGNAYDPSSSLFQWFASSASNSAHFMYIVGSPGSVIPSKFVLGISTTATLEATPPAQVQWYQLTQQTIELGFPPTLSVIIVDLDWIYDPVTAGAVYTAIGDNSMSAGQQTDLYAQVIGCSYPELTTLDYELREVNFANAPSPITNGTSFIGSSNFTIAEETSVTQHVSISGSVAQTVSLSSSTTWGAGAEISFSIPLPIEAEATVSGSFEYQNGEVADSTVETTINVDDDIELQPGHWNVTAYAKMANNYVATFTGSLQISGTIAAPNAQVGVTPLNGTLLMRIMSNPGRNGGSQAGPFVPGPNFTSAAVSGTMSGNLAFGTSLVTVPIAAT